MIGEVVGVQTDRDSIPAAFYFLLEVILPTQKFRFIPIYFSFYVLSGNSLDFLFRIEI